MRKYKLKFKNVEHITYYISAEEIEHVKRAGNIILQTDLHAVKQDLIMYDNDKPIAMRQCLALKWRKWQSIMSY